MKMRTKPIRVHGIHYRQREIARFEIGRRRNKHSRWAAQSFVAERVFVRPSRIPLKRGGIVLQDADGIATISGTVMGARGPRSIVTQHE